MAPKASPASHRKGFTAALFLMILAGVVGSRSITPATGDSRGGGLTAIAIRHTQSATIQIVRGVRPSAELLEFRTEETPVSLVLPLTWTLREVRGATIEGITTTLTEGQFRIWRLPINARASFVTGPLSHAEVHSIGTGSLLVQVRQVDLTTEKTTESSVLIKEQAARIW